jgi:hypothetical protein
MINKGLIFKLSLFGLFMGVGTVYFISSGIEPILWLVIMLLTAYFIAKQAPGKYFLHGFLLGLANCVWVTSAHILLFNAYSQNHPAEMLMMTTGPFPTQPRLMMLLTGPMIGAASGLIIGLFAFIASKIFKKPAPVA